jgi:hypothetical protein
LSRKMLKIPFNKIAEGADLCLENALQFCSDARFLSEKSSCEHALGLSILAVEELGKAIMLKTKAAFAKKKAEDVVLFERVKPEVYFNEPLESLKRRGFQNGEINPFYDHLSKLYVTRNMRYLATHERIMKSIDGKPFHSLKEINDIVGQLWKQAEEVDVENIDLRGLAFYVDFDGHKGEWTKGKINFTATKIGQFIGDIERAIALLQQWKTPTS